MGECDGQLSTLCDVILAFALTCRPLTPGTQGMYNGRDLRLTARAIGLYQMSDWSCCVDQARGFRLLGPSPRGRQHTYCIDLCCHGAVALERAPDIISWLARCFQRPSCQHSSVPATII